MKTQSKLKAYGLFGSLFTVALIGTTLAQALLLEGRLAL